MTRHRLTAPLAGFCLALVAMPAGGQDAAPATPPLAVTAEAAPPGPLRQWVLAQDLYALGVAREDALLVLVAIRLAHGTALREASGWAHSGGGTPAGGSPPAEGLPRDPAAPGAFAMASLLAEGDPALADLVADVEAELDRGRVGEPRLPAATQRIDPGVTDLWEIPFNGQVLAEVAVTGDGASNLDVVVADKDGAEICREDGPEDRAYCDFVPLRNDFFTVTVVNRGDASSVYTIITN